jgi:CitMHS family citrate-Mg2+:H+ or citrate-Ca2+:H+ symporter
MLAATGFALIAVFITLIMTRRLTPIVALIILPLIAGVLTGHAADLGDYVVEGIKSLSSTVVMLVFAILYFGVMIEAGLFDPLTRRILRVVKDDPVKIAVGTVILSLSVSLDGDGASTILIVSAAFLALYDRLGMSRVVLGALMALSITCTSLTPWGGPVMRVAAALEVEPSDLFIPMIPSMIAAMLFIICVAYIMGRRERSRLEALASSRSFTSVGAGSGSGFAGDAAAGSSDASVDHVNHAPETYSAQDRLLMWFNAILTAVLMVALVLEVWPLPVLFAVAFAIALLVNHPSPKDQGAHIAKYAASAMSVAALIFAAAVFVGVLSGTGMVDAMGRTLVEILPESWGGVFGVLVGLISMPMKFLLSNDAYYFGVLPVLAEAGAAHGLSATEVGRAALIGGPVNALSPLLPAALLLVGHLNIGLGEYQRKAAPWAVLSSLVMLAVAVGIGVVPLV